MTNLKFNNTPDFSVHIIMAIEEQLELDAERFDVETNFSGQSPAGYVNISVLDEDGCSDPHQMFVIRVADHHPGRNGIDYYIDMNTELETVCTDDEFEEYLHSTIPKERFDELVHEAVAKVQEWQEGVSHDA